MLDKPLRVFAPCGFTWNNKGDAALLIALDQAISGHFKVAELTFTSFTPGLDEPRYGRTVLAMPLTHRGLTGRIIHRILRRTPLKPITPYLVAAQVLAFLAYLKIVAALWRISPALGRLVSLPSTRKVAHAVASSDICVAVPGGYLLGPSRYDDYWLYHLVTISVALFFRKPVVLYSCSIGPFVGLNRPFARWLLPRVELIIAREEETVEKLLSLGVEPDRIRVAPDAVFGLEVAQPLQEEAPETWDMVTTVRQPLIGVSVRDFHFPGSDDPKKRWSAYVEEIRRCTHFVTKELDGSVFFVPQCIKNGGRDVEVAREIVSGLEDATNVHVIDADLSPGGLAALYGMFDMLVGTRMHANILALTQGTPVVAIAYEHKTTGIMQMLALGEWCIDIRKVEGRLALLVARAWQERDRLRDTISRNVPALKQQAREVPKMLEPFLAAWRSIEQDTRGGLDTEGVARPIRGRQAR